VGFDAVVVAGGTGRRLGGVDKGAVVVGGLSLLQRTVDALSRADRVIVVGPRRALGRNVRWTMEEPPGGGPVAALAAGLELVRADVVGVLAVDLPFVDAPLVEALVELAYGGEGALLEDEAGHLQPLAAAYRTAPLRAAVARLPSVVNAPMRALLPGMRLRSLRAGEPARDCDTWDDVAAARRALGGG
jgi:molybdopterin-guanine dinucleotide biosynthesis protein A